MVVISEKPCGTIDALTTLVTDIQNTYSTNRYLPTLCLDIEGAYDSVCLPILREKMINNFLIPIRLTDAIINFYSHRKLYIRTHNNYLIGPRYNISGLPQGSVLSPLLFNLYTADFHSIYVENITPKIIQYADDFCLYSEAKKYNDAVETLDKIYGSAYKWFN